MSAISLQYMHLLLLHCILNARTSAFSGQYKYLYISLSLSTLILQHKALLTKLTDYDKLTLNDRIVRNTIKLYVQSLIVKYLKNSYKLKKITRPKTIWRLLRAEVKAITSLNTSFKLTVTAWNIEEQTQLIYTPINNVQPRGKCNGLFVSLHFELVNYSYNTTSLCVYLSNNTLCL